MADFRLHIEKEKGGIVSAYLADIENGEPDGEPSVFWSIRIARDWTKNAQKAVLRAAFRELNSFLDLSHGGED